MSSDQPVQIPPTPQGSVIPVPPPGAEPPGAERRGEAFVTGFHGFLVLALLALAFVVGSASVRGSDFWQHLATGRLIAEGGYVFGGDPFGLPENGARWVNHSWLFDLGVYAIYPVGDWAVVLAKALLTALTFGLILSVRRAGEPMWVWVLLAALGVIAVAPLLEVRPILLSLAFLALTVRLLVRMNADAPAWRLPLCLGVLFAVWVNCDRWFFLGPMAVGLWLIGGLIHRLLGGEESRPEGGEPAADSFRDLKRVGVALVVGLAATLANPYLLGAWSLPPELFSSQLESDLGSDRGYRPLFQSPLTPTFFDEGYSDNPLTAIAYFSLIVLGLTSMGLNYRNATGEQIGLWVGFASLSLLHARAVPYFAVVAVPITAISFAEAASVWADRRWLRVGRGVGMAVAGLALPVLLFCAWPGWLNTFAASPTYAKRVHFTVREDDSFRHAAEFLGRQRREGGLPTEVRGLTDTAELAHYCAWFAPEERTFFDNRYGLQHGRAADFVTLRRALRDFGMSPPDPADREELLRLMDKYGASYLAFSVATTAEFRPVFQRLLDDPEFVCWYFDGRTGIFGRAGQGGEDEAVVRALAFDPARAAFGRDAEVVPDPQRYVAPPPRGFWDRYLSGPPEFPWAADRAEAMLVYSDWEQRSLAEAEARARIGWLARAALVGGGVATRFSLEPVNPDPFLGTMILAIRSARTAAAESPDHPAPYFVMAQSYETQAMFLASSLGLFQAAEDYLGRSPRSVADFAQMRALAAANGDAPTVQAAGLIDSLYGRQVLTALSRADQRLAASPAAVPPEMRLLAFQVRQSLSGLHLAYGQLDLALEQRRKALRSLRDAPPPDLSADELRNLTDNLEEQARWELPPDVFVALSRYRGQRIDWGPLPPEDLVGRVRDTYDNRTAASPRLRDRFGIALQLGLWGEALDMFRAAIDRDTLADEFSAPERDFVIAQFFQVALNSGSAEEALEGLDDLLVRDGRSTLDELADPDLARVYRNLVHLASLYVGRYREAVVQHDAVTGSAIPTDRETFTLKYGSLIGMGVHPFVFGLIVEGLNEGLRANASAYAEVRMKRGLIALEMGDVQLAADSLREAVRPFGLPVSFQTTPLARQYLGAIQD